MTPEKRSRIEMAVRRIEDELDHPKRGRRPVDRRIMETFAAELGASYRTAPTTNTFRLLGVSASCTWNAGEELLRAWVAAARRAMQRHPA